MPPSLLLVEDGFVDLGSGSEACGAIGGACAIAIDPDTGEPEEHPGVISLTNYQAWVERFGDPVEKWMRDRVLDAGDGSGATGTSRSPRP